MRKPRHARPCAGHPRLCDAAPRKSWMAGSSPAMTTTFCAEDSLSSSLFLFLIHRQHALGNHEAAEDIHRGKDQRDEAEPARQDRAVVVGEEGYPNRQECANPD